MAGNRGVAYIEPGKVEVQQTDYPKLELQDGPGVNPANVGRKLPHAAILKNVATNICGSDQHMVRGRTTAPAGLVLGHEITGEVVEVGPGYPVGVAHAPGCARRVGHTHLHWRLQKVLFGLLYDYVDMRLQGVSWRELQRQKLPS